eukprot:561896-Rhodomonas_salina.3
MLKSFKTLECRNAKNWCDLVALHVNGTLPFQRSQKLSAPNTNIEEYLTLCTSIWRGMSQFMRPRKIKGAGFVKSFSHSPPPLQTTVKSLPCACTWRERGGLLRDRALSAASVRVCVAQPNIAGGR